MKVCPRQRREKEDMVFLEFEVFEPRFYRYIGNIFSIPGPGGLGYCIGPREENKRKAQVLTIKFLLIQ